MTRDFAPNATLDTVRGTQDSRSRQLDELDYRILRALQFNTRITNVQLAEEVGLSPSPCWNRLRSLETQGVIERYVTIFDQAALGLPDTVIVEESATGAA